jgi:hypothetical protein
MMAIAYMTWQGIRYRRGGTRARDDVRASGGVNSVARM